MTFAAPPSPFVEIGRLDDVEAREVLLRFDERTVRGHDLVAGRRAPPLPYPGRAGVPRRPRPRPTSSRSRAPGSAPRSCPLLFGHRLAGRPGCAVGRKRGIAPCRAPRRRPTNLTSLRKSFGDLDKWRLKSSRTWPKGLTGIAGGSRSDSRLRPVRERRLEARTVLRRWWPRRGRRGSPMASGSMKIAAASERSSAPSTCAAKPAAFANRWTMGQSHHDSST